jgi:myo-inositol-1(or 4)-monophosphatase
MHMPEINHGIDELTSFAKNAMQQAGERALSFYGKGQRELRFDEELITRAEISLSEFFQRELQRYYPEHTFFQNIPDDDDKTYSHEAKRYLWIFDPLDGVANFQAGIPLWGMSLALLENYWPVLGLFYMPAIGDIFFAQAGKQAFRGDQPIRITKRQSLDDESLVLTYSRFHQHYPGTFPGKIRALGCTAAHICYVAMGRADAALIANESFQGLAACRVIIESAGGKIVRKDGSDFYLNEYLDGQRIENQLIVSTPGLFDQVRRIIQ